MVIMEKEEFLLHNRGHRSCCGAWSSGTIYLCMHDDGSADETCFDDIWICIPSLMIYPVLFPTCMRY